MKKCLKLIKGKVSRTWFRLHKPQLKNFEEVKYDFHGAIGKIKRKSGIGYRVMPLPECGTYHVVFTLDSLPELPVSRANHPARGSRGYSPSLKIQTHRFGVFTSGSDGRVIPKYIWDVDLYGDRAGEFPRDAARKAIAGVAWRTLRLSHRPERSFTMTWEGQVERMSWLGLMEQEIRWYLADDFHELKSEVIYPTGEI